MESKADAWARYMAKEAKKVGPVPPSKTCPDPSCGGKWVSLGDGEYECQKCGKADEYRAWEDPKSEHYEKKEAGVGQMMYRCGYCAETYTAASLTSPCCWTKVSPLKA